MGNLCGKDNILTVFGHVHRFEDGGYNLLIVKVHAASVALEYTFYHKAVVSVLI